MTPAFHRCSLCWPCGMVPPWCCVPGGVGLSALHDASGLFARLLSVLCQLSSKGLWIILPGAAADSSPRPRQEPAQIQAVDVREALPGREPVAGLVLLRGDRRHLRLDGGPLRR